MRCDVVTDFACCSPLPVSPHNGGSLPVQPGEESKSDRPDPAWTELLRVRLTVVVTAQLCNKTFSFFY